jgi:ubiquitin carboxyl-terminal hydrolase 10
VALPTRGNTGGDDGEPPALAEPQALSTEEPQSEASTIAAPSEPETPATSQAPSESDFTNVSTPATPAQVNSSSPKPTPTQPQHARKDTRAAIAVPAIPGLAKPKEQSPPSVSHKGGASVVGEEATSKAEEGDTKTSEATPVQEEAAKSPPPKPAPKSWADLVKRNTKKTTAPASTNGAVITNGAQLPKSASLADALKQYSVSTDAQLKYLEPRGLVNTGNMCYMNSVSLDTNLGNTFHADNMQILQVLVFCTPFYTFLDQVRQRTVHSMKSETPLVDAMIMFMREFKVLASAESVSGLRSMLKQEQLEQYADPIAPEYVYDVIKKLPRFASMRVSFADVIPRLPRH